MPFRLIDYIVSQIATDASCVLHTDTTYEKLENYTSCTESYVFLERNNSRQQIKFKIITALKKRKNVISDLM